MRSAATLLLALAALLAPAPASAEFGFLPGAEGFDADVLKLDGTPENRAGVHPDSLRIELRREPSGSFGDGDLRDLHLQMPSGLLLNPSPVASCTPAAFRTPRFSPFEASLSGESCPDASQIGVVAVRTGEGGGTTRHFGVFNLAPPYGSPFAIGFAPFGAPIVLYASVREADAGIDLHLEGLSQAHDLQSFELTLWGTPWLHTHDARRGNCLREADGGSHGKCEVPGFPNPKALEDATKSVLTLPTSCTGPLRWELSARSWQGETASTEAQSTDAKGVPLNLEACKNASTKAQLWLSTDHAATGSGLVFELAVDDGGGILNPGGIARPSIRRAEVQMPEGLTLNPSLANGLGACTEAEFAREAIDTPFGAGCPGTSKIGRVDVEGMMGQPQSLSGSIFVAEPHRNPFASLLAVYIVLSAPERGLFAKSTGKVELDPQSGRMSATFEDLPQLLYTHFTLRFREGNRPALVTPSACGTYAMQMQMRAWGRPAVLLQDSDSFVIGRGEGGRACPAGAPPFAPGALAGSLHPRAGAFSPFHLRLTRSDADAEITSYSAELPPGVLGKIAGISYCPEAAIAAAATRSGSEELRDPSCPAASAIGRTLSGYGTGPILAYAPGRLYLAGPYRGTPISVVAVNPALVGPFDLGTVIVRSALEVDPATAAMRIDSTASDPIPHIREGVPLHLRDVRVYLDRPGFMLTPTGCDRLSLTSTLTGSAAPFTDPRGARAEVSVPYQASGCEALGFSPALDMRLTGARRRGGYPGLRATLTARAGEANLKRVQVTMPRSLFLAQDHIREVCTRERFAAQNCPPGSIYGQVAVTTPLFDQPLEGPLYLRSSDNPLPDLVADLRGGPVHVVSVGRVDSVGAGRLRVSFEALPDAPLEKAVLTLPGGRRGLIVNSVGLCAARPRAEVKLLGQNNKGLLRAVPLRAKCPKGAGEPRRGRGA